MTPQLLEGCHLEVLVDENLIEVYVNDGEAVISNVVYGLKKYIGVSGGSRLRLYQMGKTEEETEDPQADSM